MTDTPPQAGSEPTTGELLSRLTQQTSDLIRSEMRLAQAEMSVKAKHAGVGLGLVGGAGVVALYAGGAGVATAVLVLSMVLDAWLAALVVTVALLVVAGVVGLLGRSQVGRATPAAPETTIDNVKRDLETVTEARR